MIEFKYEYEKSIFGIIKRPVATISLETTCARIDAAMCIDSGADISMIPLNVGFALGFKQNPDDKILEIRGVSGFGFPYIIKESFLILKSTKIKIRLAWALIEETPLLLGRMDVFNKFKILFDENSSLVTFSSH